MIDARRAELPSPAPQVWPPVVVMVAVLGVALAGWAAPASAASPKEIKASIDAAEKLLDEGAAAAAVARLAEAVADIQEAAGSDRAPSSLRLLAKRCADVRGTLADAGADVSGIEMPALGGTGKPRDAKTEPPGKPARPAAAAPASGVSFSSEIAPLLVRSCGGCHVGGKKGDFHIPSYADLMRSGMVQRGAGQASRIVEVIATGDMPRGGGKVAAEDLARLVRWIDSGAAYDGGDPALPLAALGRPPAAAKPGGQPAAPEVVKLQPGQVSFASQVAPVLIDSCLACHGGFETEAGFSLANVPRLLRGGGSGAVIEPGSSAESLLVKKLRGTGIDGQRMPLGKAPLPNEVVALIARWIDEGARLDARAPEGDLRTIAAIGRAASLSSEQLMAVRRKAAADDWRQFLPDDEGHGAEHGSLTVIGNLSPARLDDTSSVAASVWRRLGERLAGRQASRDDPAAGLVKGGVVLYAFARPYDFSEFWLARHATERPRGVIATAGVAGDVVYAAVVAAADDASADKESDLAFTIAEQLAAATFQARGAPAWFAAGAGRTLATDLVPRAAAARSWREGLPAALEGVGSADAMMSGRCEPGFASTVAGAFLERASGKGSRLPEMLAALADGADFDAVFQQTFRATPAAAFDAWRRQEEGRNRRR
jgi:hypothetical protein